MCTQSTIRTLTVQVEPGDLSVTVYLPDPDSDRAQVQVHRDGDSPLVATLPVVEIEAHQ